MVDIPQGINVYQPPQQEPTPSINIYGDEDKPIPFSQETMDNLASKYAFGAGQPELKDQYKHDMISGNEDRNRRIAAADNDIKNLRSRTELLQQLAKTKDPNVALTPDEQNLVQSLIPQQLDQYRTDPRTFYERTYAQKIMEMTQQAGYNEAFTDAWKQVSAGQPQNPFKATEDIITRQQSFIKLLQEQEAKWDELSGGSKLLNIGGNLIPLLPSVRLQEALKELTPSLFAGEVQRDAIDQLWLLPESEALDKAKTAIAALEAKNPGLALQFARNLVEYSTKDQFLDNSQMFADIGIIASPLAKTAGAISRFNPIKAGNALKDVVKATASKAHDPGAVLEATGNYEASGMLKAYNIVSSMFNKAGSPSSFQDFKNVLPSGFNPYSAVNGANGTMDNERGARIATMLVGNDEQLNKLLQNTLPINRLTPGGLAQSVALKATDELMNIQYPHIADTIIGIRTIEQGENVQGVVYRSYEIGKRQVEPGRTSVEAAPLFPKLAPERLGTTADRLLTSSNENLPREVQDRIADLQTRRDAANKAGANKRAGELSRELNHLILENISSGRLDIRGGTSKWESKALTSANDNMAVQLGRKDATLFESAEEAQRTAYEDYGLRGFHVKQRGQGYYVEYHKAVDETTVDVAKALQIETKNTTPRGLINWFTSLLGAGDKKVSAELEKDMKIATYGGSGAQKLMESVADPLRAAAGVVKHPKDYKEFVSFAEHQRDMKNPITGDRGTFSQTVQDFEKDWFDYHKKLPSEAQTEAYFSYTWLSDADYVLRSNHALKLKGRLGEENHSFAYSTMGEAGETNKVTPKPSIGGRVVKSIDFNNPGDERKIGAGVLVWDRDLTKLKQQFDGSSGYFRTQTSSKGWTLKDREKAIQDMVEKGGYKIVQLSPPGEQALKDLPHLKNADGNSILPKGRIHYVITKDLESEPLGLNQFPYKPGGHVEYPNGWYISQPNVNISGSGYKKYAVYSGDNHINFHPTENIAKDATARYNKAREMLRDGDPMFKDYYNKNLPGSSKKFRELFAGDEPAFDIHTPFWTKHSGGDLGTQKDLELKDFYKTKHNAQFRRSSDDPFDMYHNNVDLKFLGERNMPLRGLVRTGDIDAPHYHFVGNTAKLIDPVTTVDRNFSMLMRDQYLGDLKMKMAGQFVAQFKGLLTHPEGEIGLTRNPVSALMDPKWRPGLTGEDLDLARSAKNFRRTAVNFLGMKSEGEAEAKYQVANVVRSIVPHKFNEIAEPYILNKGPNPNNILKNVAFHMTQFLNIPSMVLQAQTMVNSIAIAGPLQGPKAVGKAAIFGLLRFTDDVKGAAKMAEKAFGWKQEHFIESYEAFKRTGLDVVGGEHQLRDTYFSSPMITNKGRKYLDWGNQFFSEGERWNRYTAWSAAYGEWRAANPAAKFGTSEIASVLQRSDVMSGSMSRASKAAWQQGAMSVPTQFLSYAARLTEQFWGRDLTNAERLRVFATNSALYGIPVGLAAPMTQMWPWHKEINDYLRNPSSQPGGMHVTQEDVDTNKFYKFFNDGVTGMLAEWAMGEKQNTKERLATGGLDTFRDIYKGKKSIQELIGGPAGVFSKLQEKPGQSLFWDTIVHTGQIFGVGAEHLQALAKGTPTPNAALSTQHLVDFINDFAAGNNIRKFLMMQSTGQFINKNQNIMLSDLPAKQAWATFLTGMQPQRISEMYELQADIQSRKNLQADASGKFQKYFRLAMRAPDKEDYDALMAEAQKYLIVGGFNDHELNQQLKSVSRGKEDQYFAVLQQWAKQSADHEEYMMNKLKTMGPK